MNGSVVAAIDELMGRRISSRLSLRLGVGLSWISGTFAIGYRSCSFTCLNFMIRFCDNVLFLVKLRL